MINLTTPQSYAVRHAISVGLAVLVAALANHYLSFYQSGWMVLTALLVSQTTRGTPLRQGISFFLIILLSLFFVFFLLTYAPLALILTTLGIIYLFSAYHLISRVTLTGSSYNLLVVFILVILIAILSPMMASEWLRYQVADVSLGAIIGVLFATLVFPVKLNEEFNLALLPILTALTQYAQTLEMAFSAHGKNVHVLAVQRRKLENVLQAGQSVYPEWVYEPGFNPGLRAGYRFFLIHVERLTEIFIAMDALLTRGIDPLLLEDLSETLVEVMQKNIVLLNFLRDYFAFHLVQELKDDFTSDIQAMETAIKKIIPPSLELIDIQPDYLSLTALVRDMKDAREQLLQLALALPEQI